MGRDCLPFRFFSQIIPQLFLVLTVSPCYDVRLCHRISPYYGVSPYYVCLSCLCYGVSPCYGVNMCYGFCLCYGVIPFYCVNLLWMEACRLKVGAWRSPRLLLINMVPFWIFIVSKNICIFLGGKSEFLRHPLPVTLIWMPLILGQFGTADNLAPRTIWHCGQFGTAV